MLNSILAIDTAHHQGFAALLHKGELHLRRLGGQKASEQLAGAVRELFREADITPSALELIAVGCGPGSYTGLRVGISLCKGLSLGAGTPLVGVSSLVAYVPERKSLRYLSAFDARAGGIYYLYGEQLHSVSLEEFAEVARALDVVVSPDSRLIRERIEARFGLLPVLWEEAEGQPQLLIDEARRRFLKGKGGAEALYLRKTQAERALET